MKIAVGLSGGVDSSVAALLLLKEGHEVTGITMSLWSAAEARPPDLPKGRHTCYGPDEAEDIQDARAVCERLGIPHRVFDVSAEYRALVLDDATGEYLAGRTPNPCVRCNSRVKFGMLLERAREAGVDFDRFATGHYARVRRGVGGTRHQLLKATLASKDQSYFLNRLSQEQLAQAMFPLGELRKEDVRALAREAGLPVADKVESQDFYPGDYRKLIQRAPERGPIVDTTGRKVGTHGGIWNYTRGQRRGLGVAATRPLYVVDVNARENTVVVGPREDITKSGLTAGEMNWISVPGLAEPGRYGVRIRSTHAERPATVMPLEDGGVRVDFDEPMLAITPGQSAVIYDADVVVGGGIIRGAP